ncbi:MAG: hypothetical protein P8N17_06575, partial [Luminiphilus sp.]|nr:hypothetical protein [Luminiphilus sp.]
KITQCRLLIVELSSTLTQIFIGVGNAAIKGVKVVSYRAVFTLGSISGHITLRWYRVCRENGGNAEDKQ